MGWKVLVTAPYMQPVLERFQSYFAENGIEIIAPSVNERLEEDDLLKWVHNVDGVICGDDRFTDRVLHSAKKLKVISKWGTGIDSIDQSVCQKLKIVIRNTPNAFSEPVADSVIGYMLCFTRNLPWMDRKIKEGVWDKIPGKTLAECSLGVIGVGNVGKTVVRRAIAFGMKVLGNDILEVPKGFIEETKIEMVSKEYLLAQSDFVSINCNLNPTSYHLISDQEFSLMKPGSIIINTARGPIIDEKALIRALEGNRIGGAALDVFEEEPLPVDSPLLKMDNVMLAPHNSNSSPGAWERVHWNTINNLLDELRKHRQ